MLSAAKTLDNYFLDTRCMLLEIAATLDRYDQAVDRECEPAAEIDDRLDKIHQALALLAERDTTSDRAERLLNLFSDLD